MNHILSITAVQLFDPFLDTSYLESPGFEDRRHQYQNGCFVFVGVRAKADILVNGVRQTITSGGLWGIESDSDRQYLSEVQEEEVEQLLAILQSIGFSQEAIHQNLP